MRHMYIMLAIANEGCSNEVRDTSLASAAKPSLTTNHFPTGDIWQPAAWLRSWFGCVLCRRNTSQPRNDWTYLQEWPCKSPRLPEIAF